MNADPTPTNAEVERERLDVISHSIIGAAQRVSSTLGFGFLEKVYENALVIELRKSARAVHRQAPIQVRYEGIVVGHYIPDLVVDDSVLVEIKAVVGLDRVH